MAKDNNTPPVEGGAEQTSTGSAAFKFKDAEVEKKYKAVFGKDKTIHIAGVYSGPLSNISLEVADKIVSLGDNQLAAKAGQ